MMLFPRRPDLLCTKIMRFFIMLAPSWMYNLARCSPCMVSETLAIIELPINRIK